MQLRFVIVAGLTALQAACGKPADVRPAAPAAAAPTDRPAAVPPDQATPAQAAELQRAASPAGLPATRQTRTTFKCDNGETIEVHFFPDQGVAVLVRGGQNVELRHEPAASGLRYGNGQTTLLGKGNELMLNVGTMATATCSAD